MASERLASNFNKCVSAGGRTRGNCHRVRRRM